MSAMRERLRVPDLRSLALACPGQGAPPLSPRRREPGVVAALLLTTALACAPEPPPPPAAAPSPIAWAFDAPSHWDDRVTLAEDEAPGDYLSARVFLYAPRDTTVRPQVLLGVVVYDSATWARVAAEPGPPQGDSLTSAAGQVFVAGMPQSNPFVPGSADALTFDSLTVSLDTVRLRFRVVR